MYNNKTKFDLLESSNALNYHSQLSGYIVLFLKYVVKINFWCFCNNQKQLCGYKRVINLELV